MKLLSLTIQRVDSTSFYRANGVFGDLQRKMPNLHITSMDVSDLNNFNWSDLVLFDAVFMQRPHSAVTYQLARFVKDMNIPLWIDYDDNLFEIPIDNRAHDTFSNPKVHQQIAETSKLADVITVSTIALKKVFSQFNSRVEVIHNALNTDILRPRPKKTNNTVLWRGSDTHQLDLYMYADEIFAAQKEYKEWNFMFFGYNPWFIPPADNKKYSKSIDPILYMQSIATLAPKIMYVPLLDSHFNRCKSNIAYLEGTYAGAVCLVPDWPEWQLPGTVRYKTPEEFAEKLKLLLNNKISFNKYNREAWDHITKNLTLDVVNHQRVNILTGLTAQSSKTI